MDRIPLQPARLRLETAAMTTFGVRTSALVSCRAYIPPTLDGSQEISLGAHHCVAGVGSPRVAPIWVSKREKSTGLGMVVIAARLHWLLAIAGHGVSRKGDDRNLRRSRIALQSPRSSLAIHYGQVHVEEVHVEEGHVRAAGAGLADAVLAVVGEHDLDLSKIEANR